MPEAAGRFVVAVALAVGLGLVFVRLRVLPRDLALTLYAIVVAVLGIFAILGQQAALIGGGIVVLMFCVGAAIYVSQLANPKWKEFIKPVIELLNGIPSVVLGFFALIVLASMMQAVFGYASRLNAFVAGVALGFLESSGPTELTLAAPLTAEQPEQLAPGRDALVEALEPEELVRCMQVLVGC